MNDLYAIGHDPTSRWMRISVAATLAITPRPLLRWFAAWSKSSKYMLMLHSMSLIYFDPIAWKRESMQGRKRGDLKSVSNDDTVDEREDSLFVRGRFSLVVWGKSVVRRAISSHSALDIDRVTTEWRDDRWCSSIVHRAVPDHLANESNDEVSFDTDEDSSTNHGWVPMSDVVHRDDSVEIEFQRVPVENLEEKHVSATVDVCLAELEDDVRSVAIVSIDRSIDERSPSSLVEAHRHPTVERRNSSV